MKIKWALLCALPFQLLASPKSDLKTSLAWIDKYHATFEQEVLSPDNQPLSKAKGEVWLAAPVQVRWHTQSPEESLLVSDGKDVWMYNPLLEEASVYPVQDLMNNNPFFYLVNPQSAGWEELVVEQAKPGIFDIKGGADSNIQSLSLTFKNQTLVKMQVVDNTQQQSIFRFNYVDDKVKGVFDFTPPEDVDIDDQR